METKDSSQTLPKILKEQKLKLKPTIIKINNRKDYTPPEPVGPKMQFLRQRHPEMSRKELRKLLKHVKVTRVKEDTNE